MLPDGMWYASTRKVRITRKMTTAPTMDVRVSRLMNVDERLRPPARAAATTFLVSLLCCFSLFVATDVRFSGWVSMRS
jgi:hypothetical protein